MRTASAFRLSGIALLLFVFLCSGGQKAVAASYSFDRTLTLGSYGEDVRELQKILNSDSSTRILGAGSGSPGQETRYFGPLTKAAVIRFQEKYAQKILLPNGLSAGTGIVGPATRTALVSLNDPVSPAAPSSVPTDAVKTPTSTTASQNPNLKNLDKFLIAIDDTAAKQGVSAADLATIKEKVMEGVATTTDLRAAFLKMVANKPDQPVATNSYVGTLLATIREAFGKIFLPERAYAASAAPFGGALLFTFYCNQSNTWLLTVEPLPPTYATLLTYVPWSQAFASYNIPITNFLLGFYAPGAGVCVVGACPYCITIPSWGMITPMVGSSPL
jgi:peptidoglycan hydrolase-like protein with peptidoglycan-binding domain